MDYEQPTKYLVHSTNYNGNEFDIPVLTTGKIFILGYTKETNYFDKEEIILFDDFTTDMKLVKFRFMLKSSAAKILKIKNKSNNITYIYNLLIKNRPERIGHNRHWISYTSQEYRFICNINEQSKIAKFLALLDKQIELYVSKLALTEKIKLFYLKVMY